MTTIATDGVTIAADGQRTAVSERVAVDTKKIESRGGYIFAFTGMYGLMEPAIRWYLAGADVDKAPKCPDDANWRLIVIGRDGKLRSFGSTAPLGEEFPYPQAFGSGCNYALAALLCGKSPADAVRLACDLDIYSGGEIQVVNIAEALAAPPVAEAAE